MQELLLVGSGAALSAAIFFLLISIIVTIATLRAGKANAIYAYVFFVSSILVLALFILLWHSVLERVGQEGTVTNGAISQNLSPLWLSAIGTTLLAIMTFVISILLPWWKQPRFTIEFYNKKPFCTPANEPPQSYWLRLKVTNSGKSAARSCVGRLVQFKDINRNIIDREPVRLHWVGTPWAPLELLDPIDLNQGDSVFLDVLLTKAESPPPETFLFTNALVTGAQLARARLVTAELAWSKLDKLPSDARIIRIAVYGDNVKPCPKEYSISWEGKDPKYTDIRLREADTK